MDNTNNKGYWNEYVSYWENKVKEANINEKANDKTNDDYILETYFRKLDVKETDVLLDYGCGSCRLYPIYKNLMGKNSNGYFGVDVSEVCLNHAQQKNKYLEIGKNLKEFDGLHIPFNDNMFDKIICFGVFDACNQEAVIRELFRTLKVRGLLLITGKNNKYFQDDEAASIAEVNARKKEHPNYFTDAYNFKEQLLNHNARLVEEHYFLRRGDFPMDRAVHEMPDKFYEWAFLIEKTEEYLDKRYWKFSDKFSDNYKA